MDKPIFRAGEVLDMAVRVEEQGLAFYEACRKTQSKPEIVSVLDYLIDQEERHKEVFSQMKSDAQERPIPESYPGETRSYLDSFVKDRVFPDTEKASEEISEIRNIDQIVEFGIRFEKLSIQFYSAVKQLVRGSEQRAIDQIIDQEHDHIRRLLKLRKDF
ncbi:MAG: ferritin family protein [Desulfobacterales bacterium]